MEGFEADGTVAGGRIRYTSVTIHPRFFDTDATAVTMLVILDATDTTNSTGVTMILSLVFVIQKDTDGAPVSTEAGTAHQADLCGSLLGSATHTFNRGDRMPIHCMGLFGIALLFICDFVVAKTTGHEYVAAGGQQHRFPFVMFTAFVGSRHTIMYSEVLRQR